MAIEGIIPAYIQSLTGRPKSLNTESLTRFNTLCLWITSISAQAGGAAAFGLAGKRTAELRSTDAFADRRKAAMHAETLHFHRNDNSSGKVRKRLGREEVGRGRFYNGQGGASGGRRTLFLVFERPALPRC